MTLNDASNFLESLKIDTYKKSEIKIFENFIEILTALKHRDLTEKELQSLENKLDTLELKAKIKNRTKYYKRIIEEFKIYMKDELSLTVSGYYATLGLTLGMAFGPGLGMVLGMLFPNYFERSMGIMLGLLAGIVIGQLVGNHLDTKAEMQNRILNTNKKNS